MAEFCSFSLHKLEDADITVPLVPETAIGGWSVQMQLSKRFGSTSGHILKSMASGYYGVSGMNIVNAGQGQFSFTVQSRDTSGMDAGIYAYTIRRIDSGFYTDLTQGYMSLLE